MKETPAHPFTSRRHQLKLPSFSDWQVTVSSRRAPSASDPQQHSPASSSYQVPLVNQRVVEDSFSTEDQGRSMEGYSSDGSTSFFTSEMQSGFEFPNQTFEVNEWDWVNLFMDDDKVEMDKNELADSQTNQYQSYQVETSEGSYQTKSGGGRSKLSPAQKKENKRQSDYMYRQKLKRTAAQQNAENKYSKVENELLNAENLKLKGLLDQLLHQKIPISSVDTHEKYATDNQQNAGAGTCNGNKLPIKHLIKEIDEDDESNISFSDFTGLDGERVKVGRYNFPLSLRPVVNRIMAVHGDVSATSKMNLIVVETTYILFCASIKEMEDLQLEQVTEDRILKWRDTIKDALRINFKVEFVMEHLKKIARAYIGLTERQKVEKAAIKIAKLEADLNAGKEEHAKISEQSKEYIDAADEFHGKPVSKGLFQSLPMATQLPLV